MYVCSSLGIARQRVYESYPQKPTMKNCWYLGNGSVTTGMSLATIDRGCYKRKATDSFKRIHDENPRYTRAALGNQLVRYENILYIIPHDKCSQQLQYNSVSQVASLDAVVLPALISCFCSDKTPLTRWQQHMMFVYKWSISMLNPSVCSKTFSLNARSCSCSRYLYVTIFNFSNRLWDILQVSRLE
jgi:hypothetical protein